MQSNIICSGALFYSTNTKRFLFLQRTAFKTKDTWGLVGGRMRYTESAFEGLKREIIEEVNPKFISLMMDFLLSDKKEHIDRLFNFKIYLFEQDIVKNCKDNSKKTAIRKAKTPLEAFKVFLGLWEDSNKT